MTSMTATSPPSDAVAWVSTDGTTWSHAPDGTVTKIVIGTPPKSGEDAKFASLDGEVLEKFPELLASPDLTHLHVWQIDNLPAILTQLPGKLQVLDVRGCRDLTTLPELPGTLDTLVLEDLPKLSGLVFPETGFPVLWDLSLIRSAALPAAQVNGLLERSPVLKCLNLSGLSGLVRVTLSKWPETLVDLRMNDCTGLIGLAPQQWPPKLRRLELRNSPSITGLRAFPSELDYIDLSYTKGLRSLPSLRVDQTKPRTLFLFGSGVAINPALFGSNDKDNMAAAVRADRQEAKEGTLPDNEVKIILLGNGRCGKSSLARKWIDGSFRKDEPSTHGIRLWKKALSFLPVDSRDGLEETAQLNVWDFAGQDLYHNTHRLFLQSRAIFIICYTDSGPGHDDASDEMEKEYAEEDGDVQRGLAYWETQVASLGEMPGIGGRPPVLIVRTKANRCQGTGPKGDVDFSAETGEGLEKVEEWVATSVAQILGREEARAVPTRVMEVKRVLSTMMAENDAAHRLSEETRQPVKPPFPDLSYGRFEELVREHCPGSDYAAAPQLLLERFHHGGFLFYDKEHLKERVILDQRWAVDAIYVLSNRESRWNIREKLWRRHGQFSLSFLARHSWSPAGYLPEEQEMVLQFMLSCGMCFELMSAKEAAEGEPVYVATGFLPAREDFAHRIPEIQQETGDIWKDFRLPNVTEAEMASVISNLGASWSRSAQLWRWGATVAAADSGCRAVLDWQRQGKDQYAGELRVRFAGVQDHGFAGEILDRLATICFDQETSMTIGIYQLELERTSPGGKQGIWDAAKDGIRTRKIARELVDDFSQSALPANPEKRQMVPTREDAVGIRVTLSFAGSDAAFPMVGEIPSLLGAKLKAQFDFNQKGKVFCYDQPEGEERLSKFTESLAKGDLMLIFWSEKYWRSAYCCTEMMLIFKSPPEGRLLDHRVAIWAIDGGRISKSGKVKDAEFEKYWEKASATREEVAKVEAEEDRRRTKKILKRDGILHHWYEFVDDEHDFDTFLKALREYRLGRPIRLPADTEAGEAMANQILEEVTAMLENPAGLLDLALQRLEQGRKEDAVGLLLHAMTQGPDGPQDIEKILSEKKNKGIPPELLEAAHEVLGIRNGDKK